MWIAWTVCGLLQVISARYMGTSYEWRVKLHNLSGWLTVAFAFFGFILAYINSDFKLTFNFHSIAGLVTLAQVPIVALVAMFASMKRYGTYEWDT
jgi:nitrate reductase gamma subunit